MSAATNSEWRNLLVRIVASGTTPTCRGFKTHESLVSVTHVEMRSPVLTTPERKLGYRFMCGEAAWILSGDNRLGTIRKYAKMMERFSDDGVFMSGAYGPKVVDQLPYILRSLADDHGSRQAVLTIWRERPGPSKDLPCTISIQFLIRDGRLHLVDTMRSSDAWLGVPYDWFTFSMLGAYVCLLLRDHYEVNVQPGLLTLVAGSQHTYRGGFGYDDDNVVRAITDAGEAFTYKPLDISEFSDADNFVAHLWDRANGIANGRLRWLGELEDYYASKG